MERGFWIASSALNAHQRAIDVLDNNVANLNTTGYKSSRALFSDVFSQTLKLGGAISAAGTSSVNPIQIGNGGEVTAISTSFAQGDLELTGRPMDLAIEGEGMFILRPPTGSPAEPYYSRSGHFLIDGNAGQPAVAAAGPINLVSAQGYVLQGENATIDPLTGQYTLSGAVPGTFNDIAFDTLGSMGPFATTTGSFAANLDSLSPLAIDPVVLEAEDQGVDRSFRLEFRRAAPDLGTDSFFYFTAQDPVQTLAGTYTTLTDGVTGAPISGVIRVDANGDVVSVHDNAAGTTPFLTNAAAAALPAWANVNGLGRPIFTVGTAPQLAVTETVQRAGAPVSVNLALAAPAAFNIAGGGYDAGSLAITSQGRALVSGVDYNEDSITGLITPLTSWQSVDALVSFTRGAGASVTQNQIYAQSNALGSVNFNVANVPIQPATLVVNGTRGGAALVEGTDYTVDYESGEITPLTYWDATAGLTVTYDQADTRIEVEHNLAGVPSSFLDTSIPGGAIAPTIKSTSETVVGAGMSAIDSLGNEHTLTFAFERLGDREWYWTATPIYRYEQDSTAINTSTSGGGAAGNNGMTVMPNTLIQNSDGTYQIEISIDEGSGAQDWVQIAPGAAFPATAGNSRYFQVVDATTGEVAFSREVIITSQDFSLNTLYRANTTAGDGILVYDAGGVLDAAQSTVTNAITFAPQNANVMNITADFTGTVQAATSSDIVSTTQDGFTAGTMTDWYFDKDGFIKAEFTNGLEQTIGRVGLARFNNPEGLLRRGETTFVQSSNSGAPTLFYADSSDPLGTALRAGSLEASNVDITNELTTLILLQRSYQFNSRIITTTDEMLKEAIGLKR